MKNAKERTRAYCKRALSEITKVLQDNPNDISLEIRNFKNIEVELRKMIFYLDPNKFSPGYDYYLRDSCKNKFGISEILLKAINEYKRL